MSEIDNKSKNKLTDWVNEPTIRDLQQNVEDADSDNSTHITKVEAWLDNLTMTGTAAVTTLKGSSSVAPKVIRKQAEWRYSSLAEPFLSTPDVFNVKPVTAGDRKRAKQNELVLNNQFNTKLNKTKFIDAYVRDAVDTGSVIVKVGWESEEENITHMKPIYEYIADESQESAQRYMQLAQLRQSDYESYLNYSNPGLDIALDHFIQTQGEVLIATQIGEEEVTELVETVNNPTLAVLDSRNIIVDPSCNGDIEKAGFLVERYKSSLSALKKAKKYHNLDKINIEAASPLASPDYVENDDNSSFNFIDQPRKKFVVQEYWGMWDIDKTGIAKPIVAAWVNDTLIRMEENPFPDRKIPYVLAVYMPVRRSIYGEPDGELLKENQQIIGATTRGMIDLMGKSANGQTGIRKDLLDVVNQRKFRRGDDYEFNSTVDPRQAIHSHVYPEIPQSAYNMISLQNADAESLTGVKAFNSGITGQSLGNVAAGVRSAMDAASKREVGILRRLADGLIQIGRKFISMNAEFLSEEEVIRITAEKFVTVRRDDLAGNFDLQLSISTAEEDNQRAEELAFMLQTTGPNSDPGEVRMIRAEIARLRKMPDLAKRIEEYEPQPDPMAVKKAELEIVLLEAQIEKEHALAAKHGAEAGMNQVRGHKEGTQAGLNVAKADTERAKTRHLSSDADRKDLDYLEQESGVNQERDLEKIDKKSQADIVSKFVDASLQPTQSTTTQ